MTVAIDEAWYNRLAGEMQNLSAFGPSGTTATHDLIDFAVSDDDRCMIDGRTTSSVD
jgi:hypothetical protein